MKPNYLLIVLILFVSQACNTLYNVQVIDIEIIEPARVKIPDHYKTVAIRYNNINVAQNPLSQKAYFLGETIVENENIDSIASLVYFERFMEELQQNNFFDTLIEIAPRNYNEILVSDTIAHQVINNFDSIIANTELTEKLNVYLFSKAINKLPNKDKIYSEEQFLHPRLALYTPDELQTITDSTNADVLLSFDYFSSIDGVQLEEQTSTATEIVLTQGYWNFYDLKEQSFHFSYDRKDSIYWSCFTTYKREIEKLLPPRRDAVLNAADIAGSNYANFLVPHWIQVQRMYYGSGHIELQKTTELVEEGKWMEAAEIWKANTTNPNKSIVAKCKFNMGLVCEMQGNLDAALEWVVESFHVLGQENKQHFFNCTEYIRIISQRKRDLLILDKQMSGVQ